LAPKVRKLIDSGLMTGSAGEIATTIYAYGGATLLDRELDLLLSGRKTLWRALSHFTVVVSLNMAYRHEIDLVSRIAFRELDYAAQPDGLPLDPAVAIREIMSETAAFEAEPYDLVAEMPKFNWPTVVISGGRDLVTPRAVAERVASLVPNALLLALPTTAHSAVDFREPAALAIAGAVCRGEIDKLDGQGSALDALPARPAMRLLWKAVDLAAKAEGALPAVPPRWRRLSSA
jgi:proline iminopeptidase